MQLYHLYYLLQSLLPEKTWLIYLPSGKENKNHSDSLHSIKPGSRWSLCFQKNLSAQDSSSCYARLAPAVWAAEDLMSKLMDNRHSTYTQPIQWERDLVISNWGGKSWTGVWWPAWKQEDQANTDVDYAKPAKEKQEKFSCLKVSGQFHEDER